MVACGVGTTTILILVVFATRKSKSEEALVGERWEPVNPQYPHLGPLQMA